MLCGWEVKAGMVCEWVAGKTVWSPCCDWPYLSTLAMGSSYIRALYRCPVTLTLLIGLWSYMQVCHQVCNVWPVQCYIYHNHQCPLASSKSYCLVTEVCVCVCVNNWTTCSNYVNWNGQESNPWRFDHKLTSYPLHYHATLHTTEIQSSQ